MTWTTPELAPHQRENVSALDRFNVHRCPTRRIFSGTGLELVTRQATVRYLYHSATAATGISDKTKTRATIDLLKDTFADRLISRFGPVNWPPRPCDLTPLDYFLRGYVKSLVYADKPQTLDHLEDNIRRVIADIRPQMLEKVIENWTSRLDYIRASRGSPMPEIIFKISFDKAKKPFGDGELIKEAFCKAREVLFHDFRNKSEIISSINNISLSRNTVMRRTEAMNNNLEVLLNDDLKACKLLSLQFYEFMDISDIAQLCIFVRMVFEDMTPKEELLTIIPLKGQTRGQDIYNSFKNFIDRAGFPIYKLVSTATDGAPVMVGNRIGFIALCNNDEEIPSFTSYHCITHQQVLCSKILKSNDIMQIAFKIVNSIRSRSL
ncbi:DUF4371 domain-containing protein [Trichonephila clavipes]|nr:DUF4371 domain-containing protein [Trichonephila clavipes]